MLFILGIASLALLVLCLAVVMARANGPEPEAPDCAIDDTVRRNLNA